jgi:hypothetical protein
MMTADTADHASLRLSISLTMPSSTEDTATQAQHGVYGTAAYDLAGAAQMRYIPKPAM